MAEVNKQPTKSAPDGAEKQQLTPEQRRQKYTELRARMGRSKIDVKCPPGVHVIWALKMNEYEMARLDWMGFKIVVEDMKPGAKKRFDAAGIKQDGTYALGDVILMEIDEETYELQKQIELDDFATMRMGIKQEFAGKAQEAKAPVFELNEKNERVNLTQ